MPVKKTYICQICQILARHVEKPKHLNILEDIVRLGAAPIWLF